jgi:hypothetical protein
MRKKRTIAKSRAASLKGRRTKQRMQEARSMPTADDMLQPPWDSVVEAAPQIMEAIKERKPLDINQTMPAYMRRALPNPWLAK